MSAIITDWSDGVTGFNASDMNAPLVLLDKYAAIQQNAIFSCDGAISYDNSTGVLTWAGTIRVIFNNSSGNIVENTCAAANITLADGEFAYLDLNETDATAIIMGSASIVTAAASNTLTTYRLVMGYRNTSSDDFFPVAIRKPFNGDQYIRTLTAEAIETDDILYTDTFWDDLRVPVFSTKTGSSKNPAFAKIQDDGSGSQGVFAMLFDASTEEELYFAVQMPHGYKHETNIHAHVHWAPVVNGTTGQVVNWGLEYTLVEIGGTLGTTTIASGNTREPADAAPVADKHYLTEVTEIDMTGVDSVSAMIICRVFRDATGGLGTDDLATDAALFEIDFHYEIDRPGSRDEYTK